MPRLRLAIAKRPAGSGRARLTPATVSGDDRRWIDRLGPDGWLIGVPAGTATRTRPSKGEIVPIRRPGVQPRDRVECWRSFATYVHGFPHEAGMGIGEG